MPYVQEREGKGGEEVRRAELGSNEGRICGPQPGELEQPIRARRLGAPAYPLGRMYLWTERDLLPPQRIGVVSSPLGW